MTRGSTRTESPGSLAKAKLPKATGPVPGSLTSLVTSLRATVSVHHLAASEKRVVPEVRTAAATPQPTIPSPLRIQLTGLSAGTPERSESPASGASGVVRTTKCSTAVFPVVTRGQPTPALASSCARADHPRAGRKHVVQ